MLFPAGRSSSLELMLMYLVVLAASSGGESIPKDQRLAELAERFFRWRLQESPEFGTLFGIHDFDDLLEEYTEAAFQRQLANATLFLEETSSFDRQRLTIGDRLTLDSLLYNLRMFIDGYRYRRYGMYNPISTLERPTNEWLGILSRMRLQDEVDYRKLLSRLRRLPVQIDQQIALMRQAIRNRIVIHKLSATGAVDSINQLIDNNVTTSWQYRMLFAFRPPRINEATWSAVESEGRRLIFGVVNDAWIRLRNFLSDEYLLNTRPNISVSSLAGGSEYYAACLRWHTTTNMTAEEVFQTGMNEVERISRKMEQIMRADGFHGSIRDYVRHLSSDPTNFFSTSNELLDGYKGIIDRVHVKLPLVLKKNPQVPVIVKPSSNRQGPAGTYQDPPIDLSGPGEFVANVFHPESGLKAGMMALTLHEAEPGHHTQALYSINSDMPLFRRVVEFRKYHAVPFNWPFFTAYVEGWALYAESLGEDMNVYTDRHSLFGRYASEMLRACRLVVDTGIHAFGWSKERAVAFFANYTIESAGMLDNEVNRYISIPGQATAYKIGELTIQRLKRNAQQRLGSRFDKRAFHDQILELGPLPLSVIEDYIDRWIEEVAISGSESSTVRYLGAHWFVIVVLSCLTILSATSVSPTILHSSF